MSAAISGAAGALTDTHSRWMTLIWEITECTLTPGPRLRRATITPDRRIGQPPTNHTAHTVRTGGGGGKNARAHLHTYTHAPTQPLDRTDCGACVTFLSPDIEIHLESGVSRMCAKGRRKEEGCRGR